MIDHWPLVLSAAFLGASIAAVAGTGGGIILLPVLISVFGVREAVPMYAVAQLIGNLSRVAFNWSKIEIGVVLWFSAGAMSSAIWVTGLLIGPVMVAGSYTGKLVLDRIPAHVFVWIVEVAIVSFGVWFLIK